MEDRFTVWCGPELSEDSFYKAIARTGFIVCRERFETSGSKARIGYLTSSPELLTPNSE